MVSPLFERLWAGDSLLEFPGEKITLTVLQKQLRLYKALARLVPHLPVPVPGFKELRMS